MNDSGGPSVDWATVMARAHRRVALRLALAGAIGAVGAVLLLGGGAATRAAIQEDEAGKRPGGSQPNLLVTLEVEGGAEEGEPGVPESRWTVVNDSGVDAGPFTITVTTASEGEPQPIRLEGGLAAGEEESSSFSCTPGEVATVVVDAGQEIEESAEDDNEQTITCGSESLPNLVITEITDGEVEVLNIGEATAEASALMVTFGPGGETATLSVDELAPGDAWREEFSCSGESVTATVDSEGAIEESNEEDNTGEASCGTVEPPGETEREREEREREEEEREAKEREEELQGSAEEVPG